MQPDRQSDRHARAGADVGSDPMVGRVLDGRYRIGPRIARGGMASVYEATDIRLDRTVAVKVMHPGLGDDDEFAARFVREARSAARLSHPNVVAVFDQGDDEDTVFLAMELVDGHTLRDVIRKEAPMPPARALALIEPVLSALAAAHRAGLIHRDVKPENVLIADDGRIKVADFGLARAVSTETQHTATGGVLIGTVSYLAPELVVDGRADARADVYAAGVVLYELLTGAKPHEGESPIQVAYKHVHEDVPPPSRLAPGLPAYVDALVARATARDREPAAGRRRRAAPPGAPGRARARRGRARRRGPDRRPDAAAHARRAGRGAVAGRHVAGPVRLPRVRRADGAVGVRRPHHPAQHHGARAGAPAAHPAAGPAGRRPAAAPARGWSCCSSRCCSRSAPRSAPGGTSTAATPPRPSVLGMSRAAAERGARAAPASRSSGATAPTPRPCPPAGSSAPTPTPATRCSTAAP